MNTIKKLWKLPVTSKSIISSFVNQRNNNSICEMLFDYRDEMTGGNHHSWILFFGVQELKHKFEKNLVSENLEICDYLVEFIDSGWIKQMKETASKNFKLWHEKEKDKEAVNFQEMNHYGIVLDNNTFYEVIATKYSILEPEEGLIKDMTLYDFD